MGGRIRGGLGVSPNMAPPTMTEPAHARSHAAATAPSVLAVKARTRRCLWSSPYGTPCPRHTSKPPHLSGLDHGRCRARRGQKLLAPQEETTIL